MTVRKWFSVPVVADVLLGAPSLIDDVAAFPVNQAQSQYQAWRVLIYLEADFAYLSRWVNSNRLEFSSHIPDVEGFKEGGLETVCEN